GRSAARQQRLDRLARTLELAHGLLGQLLRRWPLPGGQEEPDELRVGGAELRAHERAVPADGRAASLAQDRAAPRVRALVDLDEQLPGVLAPAVDGERRQQRDRGLLDLAACDLDARETDVGIGMSGHEVDEVGEVVERIARLL